MKMKRKNARDKAAISVGNRTTARPIGKRVSPFFIHFSILFLAALIKDF